MDRAAIVALIEKHLPQLRGVPHDTPLHGGGLIDSFDYVTIIEALESELGIALAPEELTDENFLSVDTIARFIESKCAQHGDRGA